MVDLEPQQNRKTEQLQDQGSHHWIHRYQPSNVRTAQLSNVTISRQLRDWNIRSQRDELSFLSPPCKIGHNFASMSNLVFSYSVIFSSKSRTCYSFKIEL